jgi:hypothetical protein
MIFEIGFIGPAPLQIDETALKLQRSVASRPERLSGARDGDAFI